MAIRDSIPPASHHDHAAMNINRMAASATLHCLTGCALGEVAGLILGAALGWTSAVTIAAAIFLAFVFGFTLSTLPLRRAGLSTAAAFSLVFAADTLSIATMEVADNAVMALIPGAMAAGLSDSLFWISMALSLVAAYLVAYPVNKYLLSKGKGHALVMKYRGDHDHKSH